MKTRTDLQADFTALLLMSSPQRARLEQDLATCGIRLLTASDCGQARRVLESCPDVQVVVTDVTLKDGNWCDVVKGLIDGGKRAAVLVCTRQHHERLYDEVIRRGAYYLLLEPYHRRAVELTMWAAASRRTVLSLF